MAISLFASGICGIACRDRTIAQKGTFGSEGDICGFSLLNVSRDRAVFNIVDFVYSIFGVEFGFVELIWWEIRGFIENV